MAAGAAANSARIVANIVLTVGLTAVQVVALIVAMSATHISTATAVNRVVGITVPEGMITVTMGRIR